MEQSSRLFGVELRRRRIGAGYSLEEFSGRVYYSKSHLSKVENGVKQPSDELARQCDAVLDCKGELAALLDELVGARPDRHSDGTSEVLALDIGEDGKGRVVRATRRELVATGLLSMTGLAAEADRPAGASGRRQAVVPNPALETFRSWYEQARQVGQNMDAEVLLPTLTSHAHMLSLLAGRSRGTDRLRTLALVADYAEYIGWMTQESGDDDTARWWTDQAVTFASAAGDDGMSAYALVRRALIAMYQGRAAETIALAQRAQRAWCRPRIRGLAAQREAQGHALANDARACFEALERARDLLAADPPAAGRTVIGSANVSDPVQAATGWSLYDLGRPAEAADVLREVVDAIPSHATRARNRYEARRALALAASAQMDEAVELASRVVDVQTEMRSATVAAELRRLAEVLRRRASHPGAVGLALRLHELPL
ncbi:helix-turn-helix domain-containing protein [Plantactinospora veratri]